MNPQIWIFYMLKVLLHQMDLPVWISRFPHLRLMITMTLLISLTLCLGRCKFISAQWLYGVILT